MQVTFRNRRLRSPLAQLVVMLLIVVLLIPTIPLHILKWSIDGDGFLDAKGVYAPGAVATYGSAAVALILALVFL